MRVVWTEPAETDLEDLFDYIARDSAIYAERFIDRILDAVDDRNDTINILALVHVRQDLQVQDNPPWR